MNRKVYAIYSNGSRTDITEPFNQTYAEFQQVKLSLFDYCETFKRVMDAHILIVD